MSVELSLIELERAMCQAALSGQMEFERVMLTQIAAAFVLTGRKPVDAVEEMWQLYGMVTEQLQCESGRSRGAPGGPTT